MKINEGFDNGITKPFGSILIDIHDPLDSFLLIVPSESLRMAFIELANKTNRGMLLRASLEKHITNTRAHVDLSLQTHNKGDIKQL